MQKGAATSGAFFFDTVGQRTAMPASHMENLRVVLVSTRNSLNIGAAARAISNFGAAHLRVVNPYEPSWREAKSAVGAAQLMAHALQFSSVAEAVADCSLVVGTTAVGNREIRQPLHSLEKAGPLITRRLARGNVALLFGSEKWGLSNEDLSYCHWLLRIPTREQHRSMNLGQAVAVCLYELARKKRPAKRTTASESETAASMADVDRITEVLLENLRASGYITPRGAATAEEKLRRMIRRLHLNSADATVFLGMLRKIQYKLNQ
jgi:TrmH family RNA methyltransferase